MKEPRIDKVELDKQFKELVVKLKKKYKFPFSSAHIYDRANRYSEEYYDKVKEDFIFVETISDSVCVGTYNNEPALGIESIHKCFDEYISREKNDTINIENSFPYSFQVDMERIDKTHPMYDFLKEQSGRISADGMDTFIQELYNKIFFDTKKYKEFRDYIEKLDLENQLNQVNSYKELQRLENLLFHLYPFLSSFQDSEEYLKERWAKIAERWFSLNNKSPLGLEQLLVQGYMLLDMHPLFKEKLKKGKNTLDNIVRDGNHCFYASKGQYFVSEDKYTRDKSEFLYAAYGINTKVVCEKEFLKNFEEF